MTGVIWIIQGVHYPAFEYVDRAKFKAFHMFHSNRITWIVAPVMVLELTSAFALCFTRRGWFVWNLASVVAVWCVTFFVSVPLHNQLSAHFEGTFVKKLIGTNWLRTSIWTLRSFFLIWALSWTHFRV